MKAAVVAEPGRIEVRDIPTPEPGPDEILAKVKTAGLNRADLLVAMGHFHGARGGPGAVPGIECAGEVVRSGSATSPFKQGDQVMCSVSGGFCEYVVVNVARATTMPRGLDWRQAGTMQVALQTMHNAIVTAGGLKRGESVLILGASSGVGLMGMQIAKFMGAGFVIGASTLPGFNPGGQATTLPTLMWQYLTGAYPSQREACWGIALVLMATVLFFNVLSRIFVARTQRS